MHWSLKTNFEDEQNYIFSHHPSHSWFGTIVDGSELVSVYPFQLKQLKYEDP